MYVSLYHREPTPKTAGRSQNQEDPFDKIVKQALVNPTLFVPGFQKDGFTVLDKRAISSTLVGTIERWLTSVENRPSVESLSTKLGEVIQSQDSSPEKSLSGNAKQLIQLAGAAWWNERQNVGFSLIVAMFKDKEPSRAVYFNRLMLVFGLIELAAQNPGSLRNPDDIFKALRWRSVLLPRPFLEFLQRGSQWLASWGQGAS
jgi:hypothetical protein